MGSATRWRATVLVIVALEVAALTPLWSAAGPEAGSASARLGPVDRITVDDLRSHLAFIASDALEGRGAVTPGFRVAAEYLAAHLARSGVEPGGDAGGYLQRVPLLRRVVDPARTHLTLRGDTFGPGDLIGIEEGTASGALAFVAHGYRIPARRVDPFAGLDVRGRLLVVLPGPPPGVTRGDLEAMEEGVDWTAPEANARRLGAAGILRVARARAPEAWAARVARRAARGRLTLDDRASESPLPSATVSPRLLAALFDGEPVDASRIQDPAGDEMAVPFALSPDKTVTLSVGSLVEELESWNVVGIVRGADAGLAGEFVALGAHLDHMGRIDDEDGATPVEDPIYNGADDDGSGVVALAAIAEAAAAGPRPLRSLLFVWHTAEEDGSLGARYFVEHPTVPLPQVIAQLNLDMIGRSRGPNDPGDGERELTGPREVFLVGSRRLSRDLGELCERVNRGYLRLSFNYAHDEPDHPERIYERSDHYEYAQKGIPVAFFFSGLHEDYHRPSDEVSAIDFAKLQAVTRTVMATAWALANAPERPAVDGR